MSSEAVTDRARRCLFTEHVIIQEEGDYCRWEISRGSFSRTVTLPAAIDTSKVEADYKDGLLTLKIPKMEGSKRRHIKIK
ncbi:MAG: hypothetical protein BMS9Abin01_0958 [Gammaproteobacteria bacterium]|nr:MAG: hypothetical protein BMS9Abin01_0958 [Gammaproteobacteria bacterium]